MINHQWVTDFASTINFLPAHAFAWHCIRQFECRIGGIGAWKQVCAIVLKFQNFQDILRYLENFWRYLENFWRHLDFFSRISWKIFRPNLGIFVSEPRITSLVQFQSQILTRKWWLESEVTHDQHFAQFICFVLSTHFASLRPSIWMGSV